jgi:hypothetical protein
MGQVHVQVILTNHRDAVEEVDVTEAVMVEMLVKKDERQPVSGGQHPLAFSWSYPCARSHTRRA